VSSTNRGAERRADDHYATPAWVTHAILPHLPRARVVLDPACGEGALLDAVVAWRGEATVTHGIELSPERAAVTSAKGHHVEAVDALGGLPWPASDLIIANPPFARAEDFLTRALSQGAGRTVAFLLRLAFLEGGCRRHFFAAAGMPDVYVFASRPSFTGNGKSDSAAYAWMVWGPGRAGRIRRLEDVKPRRAAT